MEFIEAQHSYKGQNSPKWIVIHDMEYPMGSGAALWCARYFAGPNAPSKSAHYCIDPSQIIQTAREEDGAWHTPGYITGLEVNRYSIGIEHAGYASYSPEQWRDANGSAELEQSAALVAEIAKRHDIPLKHLTVEELRAGESGIAGHDQFTAASGSGSHVDPGGNFPWEWYMSRVQSAGGGSPLTSPIAFLKAHPAVAVLGVAVIAGGIWAYTNPVGVRQLRRQVGF